MFNCTECNKTIGPGIKPINIVTEKRTRIYHNKVKVQRKDEDEPRLREWDTTGWEIIKERKFCETCGDTRLEKELEEVD